MPDVTQLISGTVIVGLVTLLLAYTRMKPGERERLEMEQAAVGVGVETRRLDLARSRITLVNDYEDQLAAMAKSLAAVRAEMGALQSEFETVRRALTTSEAELKAVTAERDSLRQRVADLEFWKAQVEGREL